MSEKEYKVQEHLHYAGVPSWNHCEITQDVEGADIVVLGVPFDSAVTFRPLEPGEIARYIATGEPMDKAGAYGAQGKGALFVEKIDGDFFNVMGLPLCVLGQVLKEQGVGLL